MSASVLYISLISGVYMCGIIWVVQLIHYPSFKRIKNEEFVLFHKQHTTVMGLLVGPVMVTELVSAFWLITLSVNTFSVLHLLAVILLWILTFFISVPLHNRLTQNFDENAINRLIATNWPRTLLWTSKTIITGLWASQAVNQ